VCHLRIFGYPKIIDHLVGVLLRGHAFAALLDDGAVVTWGHHASGGISVVQHQQEMDKCQL